jgi:N4-gp56 family major capsid protein
MTATTSADVFVPEVHADMAQAEFLGQVKVAGSAAVLEDSTLEGNPGDTVTFPKWAALSDLVDLNEGDVLTVEAMATTESSATIKEAGKAVGVKDRAKLVALGDPLAEAARQFGELAARKVDADLITEAQNGLPGAFDKAAAAGQTTLVWDRIVDSIVPFGDEWDPSKFAGFYINSLQMADLFRDPQFIEAAKLGQGSDLLSRGSIGLLAGVNVKVTDRVAAKKVLLIKNQALGLLYKRRPIVEHDRDILAREDVITTNLHYAVKRLNNRGVVRLTLAAA